MLRSGNILCNLLLVIPSELRRVIVLLILNDQFAGAGAGDDAGGAA